jgi:hypothetical protein
VLGRASGFCGKISVTEATVVTVTIILHSK